MGEMESLEPLGVKVSQETWVYQVSLLNTISVTISFQTNMHVKQCLPTLTLKAPRKSASENVVCLCRLLNILANFSNLFLHTGKQCGPRSDCS